MMIRLPVGEEGHIVVMPIVINFEKAKISAIAFTSRDIGTKMKDARDLEMIKRNIEAGRFPEITVES
jgi:hypothetical protein